MKHTPSPWQVWPTHWAGGSNSHQYQGHNTVWIDSPNGEVAMVRPDVGGAITEHTYANARLIAQAPAMYEALTALVKRVQSLEKPINNLIALAYFRGMEWRKEDNWAAEVDAAIAILAAVDNGSDTPGGGM